MSGRTVLSKWISEYCAPVVVTVVTAEAEAISLKNGLLLHELLSSFGHLDGLNTTIRCSNQNIHVSDAHIRFERVTEMKPKSGELIEEMMNRKFEEFDITRLPNSAPELKSNPPSGWNSVTEQLVMRSMAFTEFEMLSHPLIILTVVSTSDVDHVACMQELVSSHHTPTQMASGQYDPQIHRVFLLLHDASGEKRYDAPGILKTLQAKFTSINIILLTINSFPATAPNLQQPDMWSRFIIPKYFPQHAPGADAALAALPVHPVSGAPVLGCRLSMEDFMSLQSFCINLFNGEIVPCIERRINNLHKQVNDARKGVKNVLKSFWRKPRDESDHVKGSVKYRFDKTEAQILLLGDLSFAVKDFETAVSMYKLVRDDFKSDKSLLHLAHASLMMAACYMMLEPNKSKELHSHLEAVAQVLTASVELPYANAYFALLGSEMYVYNHSIRAPLEAAKFLLQAASTLARHPLLSSLLTERAASYFLQAGQTRRYIFNTVYVGNRLQKCGPRAVNHSAVCFASAMLVLDKGNWGDLKTKLSRSLAQYLKLLGREGAQRALVMMLKMLSAMVSENSDVGNNGSINDAVNVFGEIIDEGAWGSILIGEGWGSCQTRDVLLGVLPISPMNILSQDIAKGHSLVVGLPLPALDSRHTAILNAANGSESSNAISDKSALSAAAVEEMLLMLDVERQWMAELEAEGSTRRSLADTFAEAENDFARNRGNKFGSEVVRVPLGEPVRVRLRMSNKLPMDLRLTKVGLVVEPEADFESVDTDLILNPDEADREVVLSARPRAVGQYTVDGAKWSLSEFFSVRQPLRREGALLQKTMAQRVNRERGEDRSMLFEVIASHPLLKMSFEGLSAEVLQGQLLKSVLVLRNEGAASACDVFVKLSQPSFVLYTKGKLLPFYGKSSTVFRLSPDTVIAPGQEIRFDAWLRVTKPGLQTIALLASYKALRADGTKDFFGPGQRCRSSFISVQTRGLPAVGVTMRLMTKASSSKHHTLIAEMANFLRAPVNNQPENIRNSIGQLDLGDFSQFMEIEECGVKMIGMQMLGAAQLFRYQSEAAKPAPVQQLLAAPNERVVGCYPVKLVDNCGSKSHERPGSCSWLLPIVDSIFEDSKQIVSQAQLLEVMEQFLCIAFSADQFDREVEEARRSIRTEEMEADKSGPRTISQVRKDNQKARDSAKRSGHSSTEEDSDSDAEEEEALTDIALDDSEAAASSRVLVANPANVADIAYNEAISQNVTVALLWICRWEGKIRWGMQNASNLSFINNQSIVSSSAAVSKTKNPADFVLVGFAHEQQVELAADGSDPAVAHVVVDISLKSVHDSPLFVNLEAISDGSEGVTRDSKALQLLEKVASTGFKWSGQTRFSAVCIPPHSSVDLRLCALLYRPGVFDLKRFAIAVSLNKEAPPRSWTAKQVSGQCLIKVTESSSV